ncbi:MAG: hypothetical protein Q7U04_02410, partial [Bacteriovorax sp.]|nr:hypothetical protein [Bacteriovorax sp.]
EALDLKNDFSTVTELSKRYKNSTTATLRRYVEHSYDSPMIGLVHTPYWLDKPEDQITRCRHYIKSPLFSGKFSNVQSNYLINEVERINYKARGGPVGEGEFSLLDDNGQLHTFNSFSFFNSYYILTLIKYRQHSIQII